MSIELMHLVGMPKSTVNELRIFATNPKRVEELQVLPETQEWLQVDRKIQEDLDAERQKEQLKHAAAAGAAALALSEKSINKKVTLADLLEESEEIIRGKAKEKAVTGGFIIAQNEFLKSDIFGPSTRDFVMTLPEYFPLRAGQAQLALKAQLAEYTRIIRRIDAARVPTTLEEATELTWRDRIRNWLQKREMKRAFQRRLQGLLRQEVSYYVLSQRTYLAKRRNASAEMTAFLPHYPNPYYGDPALDFPFPPGTQPVKKSMFGMLFGKEVASTAILPSVGRKKPALLFSTVAGPTAPTGPTGGADLITVNTMHKQQRLTKQHSEINAAKSPAAPTAPAAVSRQASLGHGKIAVNDSEEKDTDASANIDGSGGEIAAQASSPSLPIEPVIAKSQASLSLQEAEMASLDSSKKSRWGFGKVDSSVVGGVGGVDGPVGGGGAFLGRRGSYPVVPGLESFSEFLQAQQQLVQGSGAHSKAGAAGVGRPPVDDISPFKGLVRRFKINVSLCN